MVPGAGVEVPAPDPSVALVQAHANTIMSVNTERLTPAAYDRARSTRMGYPDSIAAARIRVSADSTPSPQGGP
jgi:MoxR-like ATPase